MLPVVNVSYGMDLSSLVESMRQAAQADVDTEPGQRYSATPEEAQRRAAPHAEEILSQGATRVLQWKLGPGAVFVTVVLTIDAPPDGLMCWHLSTSTISLVGKQPGRVPDSWATLLAAAFGTPEEGPKEGPFTNVRHFRGPLLTPTYEAT